MHIRYGKYLNLTGLMACALLFPALMSGCGGGAGGGVVIPSGGGGGSPADTTDFKPAATNNTSNGYISDYTSTDNGTFTKVAGTRTLSGSFSGLVLGDGRLSTITLTKTSAFALNDVFTLDGTSRFDYVEGGGLIVKAWTSTGGTAKITAINGNTITVAVTNATMIPATISGATNQATGNFTVAFTCTFTTGTSLS